MTEQGSFPIDEVRAIIQAVEGSDTTELEFSKPGFRIRITRNPFGPPTEETTAKATGQTLAAEDEEYEDTSRFAKIKVPLTGIYYASPMPGLLPFVSKGDIVLKGQQIGIIEAMKIMNEVNAHTDGRLIKIYPENGAMVNANDVLMVLDITQQAPELVR